MTASGYIVVCNCNMDDILMGLYEYSNAGYAAAMARMHEVAQNPALCENSGGYVAWDMTEPLRVRVYSAHGSHFTAIAVEEVAAEETATE